MIGVEEVVVLLLLVVLLVVVGLGAGWQIMPHAKPSMNKTYLSPPLAPIHLLPPSSPSSRSPLSLLHSPPSISHTHD